MRFVLCVLLWRKNMKILIVSDTHGVHRNYDKVIEREGKIDMLLHMGDIEGGELYIENTAGCPVYMVAGNCDFYSVLPDEEEVQIGDYKILMTHGHRYYVARGTELLKKEAEMRGAQIAMYGHTHVPDIDIEGDVKVINPGSLSFPRQDGRKSSYVIMHIEQGNIDFELKYV